MQMILCRMPSYGPGCARPGNEKIHAKQFYRRCWIRLLRLRDKLENVQRRMRGQSQQFQRTSRETQTEACTHERTIHSIYCCYIFLDDVIVICFIRLWISHYPTTASALTTLISFPLVCSSTTRFIRFFRSHPFRFLSFLLFYFTSTKYLLHLQIPTAKRMAWNTADNGSQKKSPNTVSGSLPLNAKRPTGQSVLLLAVTTASTASSTNCVDCYGSTVTLNFFQTKKKGSLAQ